MRFNKECVLQEKQKHRKKILRDNLPPEIEGGPFISVGKLLDLCTWATCVMSYLGGQEVSMLFIILINNACTAAFVLPELGHLGEAPRVTGGSRDA